MGLKPGPGLRRRCRCVPLPNPTRPQMTALAHPAASLQAAPAERGLHTAARAAPAGAGAPDAAGGLPGLSLALHAALLSQATCAAAAQELVITLARQLQFSRVWLVWARGPHLQMRARSDGAGAANSRFATAQHPLMMAAAAECFDQAAALCWPPPQQPEDPQQQATELPRITRAHAALLRASRQVPEPLDVLDVQDVPPDLPPAPTAAPRHAARAPHRLSAASVPLVVAGQLLGVLSVQRQRGPAISGAELQQLEHLACLSAPLLRLMQRNERSTAQRARDAFGEAWARASRQRQQQWQLLAAGAGVAGLLVLLLPWPSQVGGPARLEGAVQRVLSAPADGFVQLVHARAGDSVRAGQPLLDLADQDLQLERQRWQSQLAQHLDALASAQARADRTQLVLQQSRADEAQAQLALTEEKLQRSRLVAPFDALVVQGDWSQQLGVPVKEGAELLTLAPLGRFRVMVEIDERDIGALHAHRAAAAAGGSPSGSLMLSALPWNPLALRVTRISPVAKAVAGRNVFEVEAELLPGRSDAMAALKPGLQGTAQLQAGDASPLWHVLRRALGAARVAWWEWWA